MVKFLCGMWVGGFIGIMMMALCVASGNADRETEKMMTVINHDKVRNCKDCKFYKVTAGVVPQHYCAAALPTEEWSKKCPLEVQKEDNSQEEKVNGVKCPNCGRVVKAWDVVEDEHRHPLCPYCGARLMGEKDEESV